ncbi:MAG: NAD-dependent epimerase/dehydratase family protein [Microbacteriaceae bacterium]|nr:NAD-dependent epimerase/dehydratase family protein [Microbacteriaceae bacterium]
MTRLWIVTGASGFVGSRLVRELVDRGERVRVLLRSGRHPSSLHGLDVERVEGDVRDLDALVRAFSGDPDGAGPADAAPPAPAGTIVVHAAGRISIDDGDDPLLEAVNVAGTANVVAACRAVGAARLVHVSSVHAIPEPADGGPIREVEPFDPALVDGPYAESKAAGSAIAIAATDLDPVLVHPSGVIGPGDPGDGNLTRLVREAVAGRLPATVPGGYDFVDVRDLADGIIRAAERGRGGRAYLLTGAFAEIADVVARAARRAGRRPPPRVPIALARWWAPVSGWFARRQGRAPLFTAYSLRTLGANGRFDRSRAETELGWRPRPLADTIDDTVDWVRVHG